jgi:16S rRNA (guanine527-N7)-methyltransferase
METNASGLVHQIRIEDAPKEVANADVVTARALAGLPALLSLAKPWLDGGATALFHKGREFREEVKVARDVYRFDLVEHPSMVDTASAILEIRMEPARNEHKSRATKDI